MDTAAFYDALAPIYHLIYADWEASIRRQGEALDAILRSLGRGSLRTVLDAACGVGTQSIGLAQRGYAVTASDLSPAAVARAQREAERRRLSLTCSVADMRRLYEHHRRAFDVVIACDNSVPHLLSNDEILHAFGAFFRCIRPGGVCLISVRDYERVEHGGVQVHPYGVRQEGRTRYVPLQVWEWAGDLYHTTLYMIEHPEGEEPRTHAVRTTYYAVPIPTLLELMQRAGFTEVQRIDGAFFQPVLVGRRPLQA